MVRCHSNAGGASITSWSAAATMARRSTSSGASASSTSRSPVSGAATISASWLTFAALHEHPGPGGELDAALAPAADGHLRADAVEPLGVHLLEHDLTAGDIRVECRRESEPPPIPPPDPAAAPQRTTDAGIARLP